jgi:small neutral amino acid transporter SnatA (MarC family)
MILFGADIVLRRLGHTGMKIIEKLMGLMLSVIAVQLIMNGVRPFLRSVLSVG